MGDIQGNAISKDARNKDATVGRHSRKRQQEPPLVGDVARIETRTATRTETRQTARAGTRTETRPTARETTRVETRTETRAATVSGDG